MWQIFRTGIMGSGFSDACVNGRKGSVKLGKSLRNYLRSFPDHFDKSGIHIARNIEADQTRTPIGAKVAGFRGISRTMARPPAAGSDA